ncbi:MAG TPA: DUF2231 domain-containing protein [Candidatus Saccharimonadales bacterium]|nr:DUF2231 domain-containing protein [Candidatus Saccharimonadales bacterium]
MAGRLKYPIHPLLVHLPIGFFVLSLALDLLSFSSLGAGLAKASFYSIALGVFTSLIAAIPGFVDYTNIRKDHIAKSTATWHMTLNLMMVGVFAVGLGLRAHSLETTPVSTFPLLLSVGGLLLLSVSGYLGGKMVYDDGIGVCRHRYHGALPEQTIGAAIPLTAGSEKAMVPISEASGMEEGQTIRVEVNGVVLAIAKVEGQFWAFQEFCTHRYGPLSEGSFEKGQVICPWHGSCFDIRTGKVKSGPAKVDLKTFPVMVRDGTIYLDATGLQTKRPKPLPAKEPKQA